MQTLQSFRATLRFVDFLERRKEVPQAIEVFQPFQILPIDVQQKIFSYLDIASIVRCLALDKCTNRIIDSVEFWNTLISRDQESWNIFGNGSFVRRTITESFFNLKLRLLGGRIDEPTQAEKLKNFYLQHQMELLPSESRLLSTLDMNSAPPVIPMFGEAGSGYGFAKKVLYNMMWTENSSLPLTTLVPGVQGVGSGVAFKIDGRVMAYSAVSKTNERNIFECMNEPGPWRDFYHNAGGLILVVNSSISLEVSAQELRAHLAHTQPNAPLLVLSVDPGLGNPVPSACQIAKALNLQELERPWRVRSCTLKDCTGIYEGLVWLKRSFLR